MANDKKVKDYAVVVGIGKYSSLKKLNGPIVDAKNFKAWLEKESGGNLPGDNIHPILFDVEPPERPLQNDIDDAMVKIFNAATVTGFRRLYFFFAGHGIGIKWNENG